LRKIKEKANPVKPSKELKRAFDRFPELLKRNEKVAKEKARIRKRFESAREEIFGKKTKLSASK
jgi:hypothetical protein